MDVASPCSKVYDVRLVELDSTSDAVTRFSPFVTPHPIPYPTQECSNRKYSPHRESIHRSNKLCWGDYKECKNDPDLFTSYEYSN